MSRKQSGYGTWESPITSKMITESGVGLMMIATDQDKSFPDRVYWSELRFDEGGRYVICSSDSSGAITQWTPSDFSARTTVHEYGGGDFFVHQGVVYFSNFKDQALYKQTSPDAKPEPITDATKKFRYADCQFSPQKSRIYCIREDHEVIGKGAKEAENTVVAIDPQNNTQSVLVRGSDFYSCPAVSPDGKKIAWVQWQHPNMPWDSTEIWMAELSASGDQIVEGTATKVAGGQDSSGQDVSAILPSWTAANQLLYIGDQSDWWNLYLVQGDHHDNLHPVSKEIGGPQWQFGRTKYVLEPNGGSRILTTFGGELGLLDLKSKAYEVLDTGLSSNTDVGWTSQSSVFCLAHSPRHFPQILQMDLNTKKVKVVRVSLNPPVDKEYFSECEKISWPTTDKDTSYGLFYPPTNKDYTAPPGELPPLLVKAHGGPTSQFSTRLDLRIQYFTSRGFAVLCVDYRGSTGYGRDYRHKLRKRWGQLDIIDCCSATDHLVSQSKVDANRLCIDGGSAGGYTTLACLTFTDTFKTGVSFYGISDLVALGEDTHKFESHYLDTLLTTDQSVWRDRSPINFTEKLDCPMGFFQGDEDKVVPPNQAEMMYKVVKDKGLPAMFVLFKGEQHGFRKAENIQTALDGEFYFFGKVLGFEPFDKGIELPIDNM